MEKKTTIVYYTDGSIEDSLAELVREYLLKADLPIISVSQEPLDFGENFCIGKIGRSYASIQAQVLVGVSRAKTEYVALCEHDTLYPPGYFDFVPFRDDVFFYNKNRVFVIAKKGPQYGAYIHYKDSHPNADQLICNRKLLMGATMVRREMLTRCPAKKLPAGWGEPGFCFPHETFTWFNSKIPSVDILHNQNFTMRYGTYRPDELSWYTPGWGKWEDVL